MEEGRGQDFQTNPETRKILAEIYLLIIKDHPDTMKLLTMNKHLSNVSMIVDTTTSCSCGKFLEQHPYRVEDIEEKDRVEKVISSIKEGMCPCLQERPEAHRRTAIKKLSHLAAIMGNVDIMRFLADTGCDINAETALIHFTPLFFAITKVRDGIVDFLLSRQVNPNTLSRIERHSSLMEALVSGRRAIFTKLLNYPQTDINTRNFRNETPLIVAVRMEDKKSVQQLLEAGADINLCDIRQKSPLIAAVRTHNGEILEQMLETGVEVNLQNSEGETALHQAAYEDIYNMVHMLLYAGADPEIKSITGYTPLVIASYNDSPHIIWLLLNYGASIEACNSQGYTSMHIASWNGYNNVVNLLLEFGAKHNCLTNDKNTPLSLAAHGNRSKIIDILLPHGCDVNNADKDLDTPLHYACYNGSVEIVQALLRAGGDPNAKNRIQTTPFWNAVYRGHKNIIKLLLEMNVKMEVASIGIDQHSQSNVVVCLYDTPRSPIWVALDEGYTDIAMMLLLAGYSIHHEQWFVSGDFPELPEDPEFTGWFLEYISSPPSLLSLCRVFFRKHFERNIISCVDKLDVPVILKKFLLLNDVLCI